MRKQWQLTRAEWNALPYDEQMEMIAEFVATNEMAAYDQHIMEKRMKRKGNK